MQKLKEECGVFGVYAGGAGCDTNLADTCYYGLFALQHRGQRAAASLSMTTGIFRSYKDVGLVEQVFKPSALSYLGQENWR